MNIEKTKKLLEEKQKLARTRKADIDDVLNAIKHAENKLLNLNIPKKYWKGSRVIVNPEKVCNSYKYSAEGTFVTIERKSKKWEVVGIFRGWTGSCARGSSKSYELELGEETFSRIPRTIKL